jgi:hypothetical protein
MQPSAGAIERWTMKNLIELVPHSTKRTWQTWIPQLVAKGVLRKKGRAWLGRRADIQDWLMSPEARE